MNIKFCIKIVAALTAAIGLFLFVSDIIFAVKQGIFIGVYFWGHLLMTVLSLYILFGNLIIGKKLDYIELLSLYSITIFVVSGVSLILMGIYDTSQKFIYVPWVAGLLSFLIMIVCIPIVAVRRSSGSGLGI